MERYTYNNDTQEGALFLYGNIGEDYWDDKEDITAANFTKWVNTMPDLQSLHIYINSFGGHVHEMLGIISAMQAINQKIPVHTYNMGMAASAGAMIWLAADKDKRHMTDHAILMMHGMLVGAYGFKEDLRNTADTVEKFEKGVKSLIPEAFGNVMDGADHWYNSEELRQMDVYNYSTTQKITEMLNTFWGAQQGPKPEEISQLKTQINDLTQKMANYSELEAAKNTLEAEKTSLTAQLTALETTKTELENTKNELETQLSDAQAKITELQAKLEETPATTAASGQYNEQNTTGSEILDAFNKAVSAEQVRFVAY